jgi:hypothetical protein
MVTQALAETPGLRYKSSLTAIVSIVFGYLQTVFTARIPSQI